MSIQTVTIAVRSMTAPSPDWGRDPAEKSPYPPFYLPVVATLKRGFLPPRAPQGPPVPLLKRSAPSFR